MEKMTYVAALTKAISLIERDLCSTIDSTDAPEWEEVMAKLTVLKAQTEKRNSADRKPTAKQVENASLAELVVEVLRNAPEPLTVTEIMGRDATLGSLSNQKVSALIRGLGARVVKTTDKRVSRFALA